MIGKQEEPLTLSNIKIGSKIKVDDKDIGKIIYLYSKYNVKLTLTNIRIGQQISFNLDDATRTGTIFELRAGYRDGNGVWVKQRYKNNDYYSTWQDQVILSGNAPGYFSVRYKDDNEEEKERELFLGKIGGALGEKTEETAPQYTFSRTNYYYENSDLLKWKTEVVQYKLIGSFMVLFEDETPDDLYGLGNTRGAYNNGYDNSMKKLTLITSYALPPSWNPYTTKTIKRNFVPPLSNSAGMRLYLNNNRYSTTGAAKGSVGLSAAASRAINRNGR